MAAPRNSVPVSDLATRRRALGLTQARLAQLVGVSRTVITLIESGGLASRPTAALIEQALEVASASQARAAKSRARVDVLAALGTLDNATATALLRGLADELDPARAPAEVAP